jgi:PhnB protein
LVVKGAADAIEFCKKAFGAEEIRRLPGPDGKLIHGAVKIGDSVVFLADEHPEFGSRGPQALVEHLSASIFTSKTWMPFSIEP